MPYRLLREPRYQILLPLRLVRSQKGGLHSSQEWSDELKSLSIKIPTS